MPRKHKKWYREAWSVIKETFSNWNESDPFRLSAVVAYYAIFSLPGLLIIVISIVGSVFGKKEVTNGISKEVSQLIGEEGARQVLTMIEQAGQQENSTVATIIGVATLLFGATGIFYQIKTSINQIWGVVAKPERAWLKVIIDRIFSFGIVLAIGFLLIISLVLSSALSAVSDQINMFFPQYSIYLFKALNIVLNLVIISVLFSLMFKILPDVKIRWRDVGVGAFVTALLFVIGKSIIGFYLGKSDPGSSYGAAGSIILILAWISYTSLILFLGVEFTQVYSKRYGRAIVPSDFAVRLPDPFQKKAVTTGGEGEE